MKLQSPALALMVVCIPWVGQVAASPVAQEEHRAEQAPGVRIERADPAPAAERRRRLSRWTELYESRLGPLRGEADVLFEALERSSLAASALLCEGVLQSASEVDRRGLFSSSEIRVDRVLFGSLERFHAGASQCLAGRYLKAYQLLDEARAGLGWIDRVLASRLRPPIPLRGLAD